MLDWFFGIFDRIIQSQIWRALLSHFQWVDWFTVAFLLVGLIYGAKKGVMRVIGEIIEAVIAVCVVMHFYDRVSHEIMLYVKFVPHKYAPVFGFFLTAIPVWVSMVFLDKKLCNLFHTKLSGPAKTVGGALAGMAYAIFLWSFLSQGIMLVPIHKIQKAYDPGVSFAGHYLKAIVPRVCAFAIVNR